MACISRKFEGSAFWPSVCDTRAAIGTAETPAEPISGLILLSPFEKKFITLASSTPPAVPIAKAITPSTRMNSVRGLRNASAVAVAPTVRPRKMTTMFISSFCTVFDRRSTTPHSFIRLPSMRQPTSGAADGSSSAMITVMISGKRIFSVFDTGRSWRILILRSFSVVSMRMIGGWITGTRAM